MRNSQTDNLEQYLEGEEVKTLSRQAVKSLLRSVLEPVVEDNYDALVLLRVFDTDSVMGVMKRLEFSNASVYSYNNILNGIENIQQHEIWDNLEFALVLSNRYMCLLLWDYTSSTLAEYANTLILFNTKEISDVYKILMQNSTQNFDKFISKFGSERRENKKMNTAIRKIIEYSKDLEQELTVNKIQASNVNQALDFEKKSKIVGHEIRNHLSVIDLYTKIIEKRVEKYGDGDKHSIQQAIKTIKGSLSSISTFLSNLKEFDDLNMTEENLGSIINNTILLAKPRADEHGIEFDFKNECTSPVFVDLKKFENVLLNIFYNAIDAIGENGKIKITALAKEETSVRILIEDTGCGVDKHVLEEIFKYGFTTKETGSGLGLHVSKISMLAQDGSLRLLDTDSDGTIFELRVKGR